MDLSIIGRGLLIGFSIAAPVGPIGVLCIRRTLTEGRLAGFVTGMGAATADAFYGLIAGFGLSLISALLLENVTAIRLVGGIFLCYLGIKTLMARPAEHAASARGGNLLVAYLSTLALTLTNPLTILSFLGVFAGLGIGAGNGVGDASLLVAGVFLGSAFWWLLLSGGVSLLRTRLKPNHLRWVNIISGTIVLAFGVLAFTLS